MGNLTGLLPWSFTYTAHIAVTAALAAMVVVLTTVVALKIHGLHFFTYFFPAGAPKLLAPLIIPIERIEGGDGWRDRAWQPDDASEFLPTRFRCSAFREQEDGRGLCGRHTLERPAVCGEFPVHVVGLDRDVAELGEVPLLTGALPRCTWYRMTVVRDDDPRVLAEAAEGEGRDG